MRTTTFLALSLVLLIAAGMAQPGRCCGAAGQKPAGTALVVKAVAAALRPSLSRGLPKAQQGGAAGAVTAPGLAILAAYKNPPLPIWVAPTFESYVGHTRPGLALAGRF
jgi:hypothetical protein